MQRTRRLVMLTVVGLAAVLLSTAAGTTVSARGSTSAISLPVAAVQSALHAKGTVSNGVLDVEIDRDDLGVHHLRGVPVSASFQINGSLTFQPLAHGRALFNGDFPLKPNEIDPFVSALIGNHLVFQAEHQHFYDLSPMVWFIHFRAIGDPVQIAREVYAVMRTTSVQLPQSPPAHPHTQLDVGRLKAILGTSDATVGEGGVVTLTLTQKHAVSLGGVHLDQDANAETNIAFEPLNASGSRVAVAPDFGMTAGQVQGVMGVMRSFGWDIGCLYNQETDESPQLYFSHVFKTGDPYALAQEVRDALDRMHED